MLREYANSESCILRIAKTIKQNEKQDKISQKTKNTPLKPQEEKKISLHGHCYQKARPPANDGLPVGQEASAEILRAVGYEVEIIPSGCCGMAGAFGYEEEHYELSMQVGELVLFPEIRQKIAKNGTVSVVAPGTSCREQIKDGVGVTASHPLVLVANLISQ